MDLVNSFQITELTDTQKVGEMTNLPPDVWTSLI